MSSFKFALLTSTQLSVYVYVHTYREDVRFLLSFPGPPLNLHNSSLQIKIEQCGDQCFSQPGVRISHCPATFGV